MYTLSLYFQFFRDSFLLQRSNAELSFTGVPPSIQNDDKATQDTTVIIHVHLFFRQKLGM